MLVRNYLSNLAIVAGKGDLPKMIIKKCQEQNRQFIVILINGEVRNSKK
jgi:DUF1009 family protein